MAVDVDPNLRTDRPTERRRSEASRGRTILFFLPSLDYLRFFQTALEQLPERGHRMHLAIGRASHGPREQAWLDGMVGHANFVYEIVEHFHDRHSKRSSALRRGLEYLRSLEPSYTWRAGARKREKRSPAVVRLLVRLPGLRKLPAVRRVARMLSAIDRMLPSPGHAAEYVERLRPDLVALCDHGAPGSLNSTYVKAAKQLGIPTVICVASWDNLTTRQQMREIPHSVLVWNETQVKEAAEIHGVPPDRVVVTGAPSFDEWFSRTATPRGSFLERVGLDPDKPVILWVGGALKRTERTEAQFAADWIRQLRSSSHPVLREAGVLLRPHPYRVEEWTKVDVSGLGNAVVWPREDMTMPIETEQRADYYDSIFHSLAVVGVNSSAMIEASIIGRPVLALTEPGFYDSQLGTYHFSYLLDSNGGPVRVVESFDEGLEALGAILEGHDEDAERVRRFVQDFVRPRGLDRPAVPIFVEALEHVAATPASEERTPIWITAARAVVVPLLWVYDLVAGTIPYRTLRLVRRHVAPWLRVRGKRLKRFVLVWLRAAVRQRLARLRG
jgi:hypothetical protein